MVIYTAIHTIYRFSALFWIICSLYMLFLAGSSLLFRAFLAMALLFFLSRARLFCKEVTLMMMMKMGYELDQRPM